jgi:glutamyl-tRNA synthetase
VATTGKAAGFGMFETLAVIGKQKTVQRIDAAIQRAAEMKPSS